LLCERRGRDEGEEQGAENAEHGASS
jgi:hypothetical protein